MANSYAPVPASPAIPKSGRVLLPPGEAIHAGLWRRNAAWTLDFLILVIPLAIVSCVPFLGGVISLIGQWLYFALMDSSQHQATPGKRAMGIKVVDKYGRRLDFGQATGRFFSELIGGVIMLIGFIPLMVVIVIAAVSKNSHPSIRGIIFSLAFLMAAFIIGTVTYMMMGWTKRKQSLYDKIAGTLIVFKEVQPGQPLPAQRPPMPWHGWVLNIAPLVLSVIIGILVGIAAAVHQHHTIQAKVMAAIDAAHATRMQAAIEGWQPGSRPATRSFF